MDSFECFILWQPASDKPVVTGCGSYPICRMQVTQQSVISLYRQKAPIRLNEEDDK